MKRILLLLAACALIFAAGCTASDHTAAPAVFAIDDYGLQLTADSSFREDTNGSFDLQITNDKAYISVMAYKYTDLPDSTTPLDVYHTQNEDLFSKRDAVTAIEESETRGLYSAQRDGVKNYYATYLLDFPEAETFAWVLITATPSYLEANRDSLDSIVETLTPIA